MTGSDARHLADLTEAQRDQAMARWQVLRPHIEDGVPLTRLAGQAESPPGRCSGGRPVTALTAWPAWPAASEPTGEPGGSPTSCSCSSRAWP